MSPAPIPANEEERLRVLAQFVVLDTALEERFDKITALVAVICKTPIALVSFVGATRQWFKSAVGFPICESSRETSFCAYVLNQSDGVFVVEDAQTDSRFSDNPLVVGAPGVRFYAGAPLTTSDGLTLGSVCVIDHVRRSLSADQSTTLQIAARSIVALLEHRRSFDTLRETFAVQTRATSGSASRSTGAHARGSSYAPSLHAAPISTSVDLTADVINAIPGIFYLFGASGKFALWNRHLEEITGYSAEEIAAIDPLDMVDESDRDYVADRIRHGFKHGATTYESALLTKSGNALPYLFSGKVIGYEGQPCLAGTGIDISDRKHSEELLKYAALHDPLTGLGNRTLLSDRLLQSVRTAGRTGDQVAVFVLHLDRSKLMNDTPGYSVEDELVKAVALRIRGCLRVEDTVARLGGDEFVVVADVARSADVIALVGSVMGAFDKPFSINGRLLHVTTSMGISVYPSDGTEPEHLLRNADTAMYGAKDLGRNAFQFFTRDMHAAAINRLSIESDLRHALENGELELYYQPVVDLRTGATVSAEALIRWNHPTRGLIMPGDFIAIAEETGLIVPIGAWVLQEGARQARRLPQLGFEGCYISVNVSGRQLSDPAFLEHARSALRESRNVPGSLGIEITESAALGDPDRALAVLDECKRLGLLILLDDFGTHYSSLAYLKKFPIDVIKIDKSFIDGLPESTDDSGIVKAIVALGHSLDCDVLAEGVESAAQARWLVEHDCRYATGYLYARPMPSRNFEQWVRSRGDRAAF